AVVAAARRRAAGPRRLKPPRIEFDALLVGSPGHFDLPAARVAARGRPVVFNPLVSLSDTFVGDRGRFGPGSAPARALAAVDRRALRAASLVVADTRADADHLAELAGPSPPRLPVALVGAGVRPFPPRSAPARPLTRPLRPQA